MNKVLGSIIISSSTILYAFIGVLFKKANREVPPFSTMAISMFFLFIVSLIFSLIYEKSHQFNWSEIKTPVLFLIIAGVVNFFAFWLGILGYKYLPLWQQSMFGLLSPIFIGVFGYFLLGEQISIKLLFGLIFMGIGLFIVVR